MIYENKALSGGMTFPLLMQAWQDAGISPETIAIVENYLDLSQPRDNSLLDQIQTIDLVSPLSGSCWQNILKAIRKEIESIQAELPERYCLAAHAAVGAYAGELGIYAFDFHHREKRNNLLKTAFQSRFGKDADAVLLAISLTHACKISMISNFRIDKHEESAETCLKAISFTNHYAAKLILMIHALNQVTPPEKAKGLKALFQPKDAFYKKMLSIFDDLLSEQPAHSETLHHCIIALALASPFDRKYFSMFQNSINGRQSQIADLVMNSGLDKDRIFDVMDQLDSIDLKYISCIANTKNKKTEYILNRDYLPDRDNHLKHLALRFPKEYHQQMLAESDIEAADHMEKILIAIDKSYQAGEILKNQAKQKCANILTKENPQYKYEIEKYLFGKSDIEEFLLIAPKLKALDNWYWGGNGINYIGVYGLDDFAKRCICYWAVTSYECPGVIGGIPGYRFKSHETELINILLEYHIPMIYILNAASILAADYFVEDPKKAVLKKFLTMPEEIIDIDLKPLCVEARCMRVQVLGKRAKVNPEKYQSYLFAAADDSSKKVRQLATEYLPPPDENLNAELLALLTAKKIAKREFAAILLEKNFPAVYHDAVQNALAIEKNDKLRTRFASLLHADASAETQQSTIESIIEDLIKGNKFRKTSWLFDTPFTPVHDQQGNEVSEKYLRALMNCYAASIEIKRNPVADQLAENLNSLDLEHFTQEVFSRFVDKGAEVKQKWVIYFIGIHGGLEGITILQHYIKEWSENHRGAIASDAVQALALNGSSAALMAVDDMARKFKNRQVRNTAVSALQSAADALQLTKEELADKIVPDLGFDESLCRIFDFGSRQFKVYLTSALELEIFEEDKKLKNLPKPGKNDDPEKAEASSKAFKEMKKQLKTVVQSQKSRLEYVFLCDRKWTCEGWKALFIQKPVMHCFAIGLIWGVYENNQLIQTFRYMEDGSFNTAEEEEYELPDNMQIGLVHPIELEEETLTAWKEQLSDYEIHQPFPQIERSVYQIHPEEKGKTALHRFTGMSINNLSLLGKMTKFGWEKGIPGNAGWFTEYCRTDIEHQEKHGDKIQFIGYYAKLEFSGMDISSYVKSENVTIEDITFWSLSDRRTPLKLEHINPRYFSEMILQLTSILGEIKHES